jgi:hypothetical protein
MWILLPGPKLWRSVISFSGEWGPDFQSLVWGMGATTVAGLAEANFHGPEIPTEI